VLSTQSYASGVRLRHVLPEAGFYGADDLAVTSCCADSRQIRRGDLFVAIAGTQHDGHDYVQEAIDAGAAAVLAEQYVPTPGLPVCTVRDTRSAYGRLCQALAGDPSQELPVIGVTGTNGKTTTSWLIASILKAAGGEVGVMGTLGYCDTVDSVAAPLTTPTAPVVASWLARMQANGCSHAVMEVSSHALAQHRVAGVQYDAACLTNIRRDHLDYHNSVQNYRDIKARLFRQLAPHGLSIINADDPASVECLTTLDGPVLTIGMEKPAEITATIVEQFRSEQTFLLSAGSDTVPVRTKMIGTHHVYNCLTAAALGLGYGIDLATIVRGLEMAPPVPGRLERIECGQDFGVFVDYAHTPDALLAVLKSLREVTEGRVICVFGAGGDRDRQKRSLMGRVVQTHADVTVVTSDNPRTEDPRAIVRDIMCGFKQPFGVEVQVDRAEAIRWALGEAREGDCVLIAGKGHEDYQIIGQRREHFDDREFARTWLYEKAAVADCFKRAA
jgi:UDP-N-acetylmuramoyl-L-alanyl-D-glutamate--2,6-diaminopimelate ligase